PVSSFHAPGLLPFPTRRSSDLEQSVLLVDRSKKRPLLSHLISSRRWTQVLVFTRTKHGANRLAEQLGRDGIQAMAIHGNKSQGRSEEHTSELPSRENRVCRPLL